MPTPTQRAAQLLLAAGLSVLLMVALLPGRAAGKNAEASVLKGDVATGRAVYVAACATCHGLKGNGKGPGARGFAQHATDFTLGKYKLRSVNGDIPAPGDLERTIREGMPGTEMVPFRGALSERSIRAVAAYVRTFSRDLADPDAVPDEDDVVNLPRIRPFARSAETVAEGKELFSSLGCTDCHGAQGEGSDEETDDAKLPVVMIPFREGYLKSGASDFDLYRSIATGMSGTTMDAYTGEADENDIWKMVDFIRSLSKRETQGFIARMLDTFLGERPSGFDYSTY